jgi:central glycolytic genes regulator
MDLIEIERKIVPEILDMLELRYQILRNVYYNQPIGRRGIANKLNIGERTVRTEVNILKKQGLIDIGTTGMYITEDGKTVIYNLEGVIRELKGITELEKRLRSILNIKNIIIVPGDCDNNELVLKDLAKAASSYLSKVVKDEYIIGVTGGSTIAKVADEMPQGRIADDILVIPARGGLGRDVETQSNTIAAKLAKKLEGSYRLLHVPDSIDKKTLEAMLELKEVTEVIQLFDKMNVLLFGIGRADVMAMRRSLSQDQIDIILNRGAVGEAFGHYFDIKGNEVWKSLSVGIDLDVFKKVNTVIGVAGGEKKAEAIMSIASLREDMTLVMDEAAANRIIKIANEATK